MSNSCESKSLNLHADETFRTDIGLTELRQRIGSTEFDSDVYYYVVRTVTLRQGQFSQDGSAPNFDGGRLTLCTCKHWMRTLRPLDQWGGVWVAGFAGIGIHESRSKDGGNFM